jgi:hypothetical protein
LLAWWAIRPAAAALPSGQQHVQHALFSWLVRLTVLFLRLTVIF